jgi:uncharacterized LabA/DUF88 family protein
VVDQRPADQTDGQHSDDEGRRRRGSRGGRGRGGRGADGEQQQARTTTAGDEPRIVGRRPGRPALGPAAEAPRETGEPPSRRARRGSERASEPAREQEPAAEATTAAPTRRGAATNTELANRVAELTSALAEQNKQLAELQEDLHVLGEQVERSARRARLGVFVDVPNLLYGSDLPLDMGKLLAYLADGRDVVRATAYAPVSDNPMEPVQQQRFVAPFIPYEYRIVTKPLKRFADGSIKGNFDVEMAVDLLTMADRLDVIAIVSGDADFARVVEEVQSKGVRVEVVAFGGSTSAEMRGLADRYIEVGAIAHLLRA